MAQKGNEKSSSGPPPDYPRAPPFNDFDDNVLVQRPAPPSYDESLRQQQMQTQYQYQQQFPQVQYQQQQQGAMYMQTSYVYPAGYGAQPYAAGSAQMYVAASSQPQVLTLAQGAEIRQNANGAVSIPPPPPGYAPTAAQWAAMQGQQVLVKEQKKRSFFS